MRAIWSLAHQGEYKYKNIERVEWKRSTVCIKFKNVIEEKGNRKEITFLKRIEHQKNLLLAFFGGRG